MAISENRRDILKAMLEGRRQEIQPQLNTMAAEQRQREDRRGDNFDETEAEIQDDINFALLQMKAETLNKLVDALHRLEQDAYGYCFDCGGEISEQRLLALPFAARCKSCEEAREIVLQRERELARRRGTPGFYYEE